MRVRKEQRRKDGTYIRFDSNAAVLVNELGEPVEVLVDRRLAGRARRGSFDLGGTQPAAYSAMADPAD